MMSTAQRVIAYAHQGPKVFTPAQRRRMVKKARSSTTKDRIITLADRHGESAGIDAILMATRPSARQDLINDILTRSA